MLPIALLIIFNVEASSVGSVALSELALASLPAVGNGLTTQLVAEAFSQLDVNGDQELSVSEFAPIGVPLYKEFADLYIDDSGEYVLREKFVDHVYVPDFHAITGDSVDNFVCVADSIYVALDSSQMWSDMFGDVAFVDADTFAQTLYVMIADGRVYSLSDLEELILGDIPTDMPASISIDEYNTGNENCANSITGKRRQLLHPFLRFTRWGILSFLVSALGCFGETAFGDDCAHSSTSMGRAIGVGSTVSGGVEGLFWLRQRFLMRNFVEPPPFDVPLEPVVIGVPHNPPVLTPNGGPINPADFEAGFEPAAEIGGTVMEAAEGAAAVGEGVAVAAEAAEGAAILGGLMEAAGIGALSVGLGRR